MDVAPDLSEQALTEALGQRPFRCYPAVLSTQSDALAWARAGAPQGAVVVAEYQASPRGRAGLEWKVEQGVSAGFSLVLRPRLTPEREGWLYSVVAQALAECSGDAAAVAWPDRVYVDGELVAAAGIDVELGPATTNWAVVNFLLPQPREPRCDLIARISSSVEVLLAATPEEVLERLLPRCATIGRHVKTRMIPMGPGGIEISGTAVGTLMDGALLVEQEDGRRVAVRPQNVGSIEEDPPF